MQIQLFAVGEGVHEEILAADNISLNANLAKYREGVKAGKMRKNRKNRNRSSELNGKNRYRNPQKPDCRTVLCYG